MRVVAAVAAMLLCLSPSAAALQLETVDGSPRMFNRKMLRVSRPVLAGAGAGLVGGLLVGSAIGSHRTSFCSGYDNQGNRNGNYQQSCDCSIPNNRNCAYRNGSTTCGTGCKVGAAIGGIVFLIALFGLLFLCFTCLCGAAAASRRRPPQPVGTTYGAQQPAQYGQYPQNQAYPPQGYPQAGYPPPGYNTGGYNAGPAYPPPQGWEGQPAVGVPAPKPV